MSLFDALENSKRRLGKSGGHIDLGLVGVLFSPNPQHYNVAHLLQSRFCTSHGYFHLGGVSSDSGLFYMSSGSHFIVTAILMDPSDKTISEYAAIILLEFAYLMACYPSVLIHRVRQHNMSRCITLSAFVDNSGTTSISQVWATHGPL